MSTGHRQDHEQSSISRGSKQASKRAYGRTRVSVKRKRPRRLWWATDSNGKGSTESPPACAGGAKTCTRWHTAILCGVSSRSALPVPPADAGSADSAPPPTPANRLMAPPAVAAGDEGFKNSLFFLARGLKAWSSAQHVCVAESGVATAITKTSVRGYRI